MEAGRKLLAGGTARDATCDEVDELRVETRQRNGSLAKATLDARQLPFAKRIRNSRTMVSALELALHWDDPAKRAIRVIAPRDGRAKCFAPDQNSRVIQRSLPRLNPVQDFLRQGSQGASGFSRVLAVE